MLSIDKWSILKIRLTKWDFVWPIAILSLFFSSVYILEFYIVGLRSNPTDIEQYYFGSEAMLQKGGWHYVSAEAYSNSALLSGSFSLVFGIFLIISQRTRSIKFLLLSVCILGCWPFSLFILEKICLRGNFY